MEFSPPFVAAWLANEPDGGAFLHVLTTASHNKIAFFLCPLIEGALEDLLPGEILSPLRLLQQGHGGSRSLLLLDRSLPDEWMAFDWESATLDGRAVGADLLVVRHARVEFGIDPAAKGGDCRYLDLFPADEFDFVRALQPEIVNERLGPCLQFILREQLAVSRELFILAHGDERGLLGVDGNPYSLPETKALPEIVWLLACNKAGAMNRLARELIQRGVRTVLVAMGDLSAPQMIPIIERRLSLANTVDPAVWLATTGFVQNGPGGALALSVFGEVRLDSTISAPWNALTWGSENGRRPRFPLDDETSGDEFEEAVAALDATATWPLTREWMLPPLLWLAEKHDHGRMQKFVIRVGSSESPEVQRVLATAARRVGNYPQMARHLSRGLRANGVSAQDRARDLGSLGNLLIDLDLPESANQAIVLHEDCLIEDPIHRQEADLRRLDFKSRASARQGRVDIALGYMTKKRKQAGPDASREVAGQLYLCAWGVSAKVVEPGVARAYVMEAEKCLLDVDRDAIGNGNETNGYILRALACYAWASGDKALFNTVQAWQEFCEQRLSGIDPGPWAYALVFLHLAGRANGPVFARAIEALRDARYFLEAAMFLGLAGDLEERAKVLSRFQERRSATLAELEGGINLLGFDPAGEAERRSIVENETKNLAADMVLRGVLPL